METEGLRINEKRHRYFHLLDRQLVPDKESHRPNSLLIELSSRLKTDFKADPDWDFIETILSLDKDINVLGRRISNLWHAKNSAGYHTRNFKRYRWKKALEKRYGKTNVECVTKIKPRPWYTMRMPEGGQF